MKRKAGSYYATAPPKRKRAPHKLVLSRLGRSGETKYFDTSFQQSPIASAADWTGTEVPCTNYIQSDGTTVGSYTASALIPSANGAGYGQVVGSKYSIKKIRVRGQVVAAALPDQADVPAMQTVRLVLVEDLQPNGAQAQGEDVFTDLGGAAQVQYSFLAMAAGAGGRFRILKDEILTLQPASSGTDGTNTNSVVLEGATFNWTWAPKKSVPVRIKANASSPAVAALSDRNIFLLAHSSAGTVSIAINGCARCYYNDQ